jgi:diguanylate cyclase (GGDEF)-like protein
MNEGLSVETLPDSEYAVHLQQETRAAPFPEPIESQYLRSVLRNHRIAVRGACSLATLLIALRALQTLLGHRLPFLTVPVAVVSLSSVCLLWLAWSPSYEHRYLPMARVLVPLRNVLGTVLVVRAAAAGATDALMVAPLALIGPFFFLGLTFRSGLLAAGLALMSELAAAWWYHPAANTVMSTALFMVSTFLACALGALALERQSRRAFLESQLIAELAQHDVLTWTKNRRMFDESLARLWRQASSDARPMAIMLIDIDDFKAFNDRYGHQAGDAALRQTALAIQCCARRPLDLVARYGGEEFGVILFDTDRAGAQAIAESMRRAVQERSIEHDASRCCEVLTISVGVAVVEPTAWRNPYGALQLADEALYRAKSSGRNRVELMDDVEHRLLVTGEFSTDIIAQLKSATPGA